MATLPELNREAVRSRLAQQWSQDFVTVAITKAQLKAAVDAMDIYINNTAVAANNALPAEAKALLSKKMKAELYEAVLIERKWEDV